MTFAMIFLHIVVPGEGHLLYHTTVEEINGSPDLYLVQCAAARFSKEYGIPGNTPYHICDWKVIRKDCSWIQSTDWAMLRHWPTPKGEM